jgi:hypothetical protein
MSSTKFLMTRDISGTNGFGVVFAQDGKSAVLAAGVEQHFTVPSNFPHWIAIFSYTPGASVWVDGITTAVAPTGAFADTTADLNPAAREVKAGQVLSFITSDASQPMVGVKLYVAPPF